MNDELQSLRASELCQRAAVEFASYVRAKRSMQADHPFTHVVPGFRLEKMDYDPVGGGPITAEAMYRATDEENPLRLYFSINDEGQKPGTYAVEGSIKRVQRMPLLPKLNKRIVDFSNILDWHLDAELTADGLSGTYSDRRHEIGKGDYTVDSTGDNLESLAERMISRGLSDIFLLNFKGALNYLAEHRKEPMLVTLLSEGTKKAEGVIQGRTDLMRRQPVLQLVSTYPISPQSDISVGKASEQVLELDKLVEKGMLSLVRQYQEKRR